MEDPYEIYVQKESNTKELENELLHYMKGGPPDFVLCLLSYENNYAAFKNLMFHNKLPSQVIKYSNAKTFNLSKASKVLIQVNAKLGGDTYRLQFPQILEKKRTMLIGIDVCHSGSQSIVGFCATYNPEMSQYYSAIYLQKKNQEIVT